MGNNCSLAIDTTAIETVIAAVGDVVVATGGMVATIHDNYLPAVKTDTENIRTEDVINIRQDIADKPDPMSAYILSDDLLHSNDDLESTTGEVYVKLKEIICPVTETLRIKFDMRLVEGGTNVWARIYKNDVEFGTEQSENYTEFVTYPEDLAFEIGDLIQLYGKSHDSLTCEVQNLRIYGKLINEFENVIV